MVCLVFHTYNSVEICFKKCRIRFQNILCKISYSIFLTFVPQAISNSLFFLLLLLLYFLSFHFIHSVSREGLSRLRILVLNSTNLKWHQIIQLRHYIPDLEELHLASNHIQTLSQDGERQVHGSIDALEGWNSLTLINLNDNEISSWEQIWKLRKLCTLQRLMLNGNQLSGVSYEHNSEEKGVERYFLK